MLNARLRAHPSEDEFRDGFAKRHGPSFCVVPDNRDYFIVEYDRDSQIESLRYEMRCNP